MYIYKIIYLDRACAILDWLAGWHVLVTRVSMVGCIYLATLSARPPMFDRMNT